MPGGVIMAAKSRIRVAIAALPVALCVLLTLLWARSYWYHDYIGYMSQKGRIEVATTFGLLAFRNYQFYPAHQSQLEHRGWYGGSFAAPAIRLSQRSHSWWNFLGFGTTHVGRVNEAISSNDSIHVPLWLIRLISVAIAIQPTLFLWRESQAAVRAWQQAKRAKLGLCIICGYDLRVSNERCPECGVPIKAVADGALEKQI